MLKLPERDGWVYNYHVMLASAMKYSMMVCIFHKNRYLVGKNFFKSIMFVSLRSGKYYSLSVIYMLFFFPFFEQTHCSCLHPLFHSSHPKLWYIDHLYQYHGRDVLQKSHGLWWIRTSAKETILLACFLGLLKHSKVLLLCV